MKKFEEISSMLLTPIFNKDLNTGALVRHVDDCNSRGFIVGMGCGSERTVMWSVTPDHMRMVAGYVKRTNPKNKRRQTILP